MEAAQAAEGPTEEGEPDSENPVLDAAGAADSGADGVPERDQLYEPDEEEMQMPVAVRVPQVLAGGELADPPVV